ncbi:hypothetical protein HDU89_008570 [Geranomyces variabilis]|nr:hypothetical protein HDU89_008570 [Geranomyces variabilis]
MLKGLIKVAGFGTDDDSSPEREAPGPPEVRQDDKPNKLDSTQSEEPVEAKIGCTITEPPSPSDPHAKPTISSGTATKAVVKSRHSSGRIPRTSLGTNATVTIKQAHSCEVPNSQIRSPEVHVKVPLRHSAQPGVVRVTAMPAKYNSNSNSKTYASAVGRADNVETGRFQWSSDFGRAISVTSESPSSISGNPPDHDQRRMSTDAQPMVGAQSGKAASQSTDGTGRHQFGPENQTSAPPIGGHHEFALPDIQRLKRSPGSDSPFSSDSTNTSGDHDSRGDVSLSVSDKAQPVTSSFAANKGSDKPHQDGKPPALKQPSAFEETSAVHADIMTAPTWFLPNSLPNILASKEKDANIHPLEKSMPRLDVSSKPDITPGTPMRGADVVTLPNSQKHNVSSLNNPTHKPTPKDSGVGAPLTSEPATKYFNYKYEQSAESQARNAGAAATIDLTTEIGSESKQQFARTTNHHSRDTSDITSKHKDFDSTERQLATHGGHNHHPKPGKGKHQGRATRDHEHNSRARHEGYKRQELKPRDSYRPERDGRNGSDGQYGTSGRHRREVQGHIYNSEYSGHSRNRDIVMDYNYPRNNRAIGMHEERNVRVQPTSRRFDDPIIEVDERVIGPMRAEGYDTGLERNRESRIVSYKHFDDRRRGDFDPYEQRAWRGQRSNRDDSPMGRFEERAIAIDRRVPIEDDIIPQRESPAASRKRYRTDDHLQTDRDIDPFEQRVWRSLRNGGGGSNVPSRLADREFDPYQERVLLSQRLVDDSAVLSRYDERTSGLGRASVNYRERADSPYLRREDLDQPSSVNRQRTEYEVLPRIRRHDTNIIYNDEELRQQTPRIVRQELEAALGSLARSSMSRAMLDRP